MKVTPLDDDEDAPASATADTMGGTGAADAAAIGRVRDAVEAVLPEDHKKRAASGAVQN